MEINYDVVIGLLGSAILAYFIPKISPFIDELFSHVSNFFLNRLPAGIKGYFRKRRLDKLKEIRKIRYNQDAVIFQTIKAHSYFILFWGVIFFYVLLLVVGPYESFINGNKILSLIYTLPIYVFEIFWLLETKKAKILVKNRGYLCITRQ